MKPIVKNEKATSLVCRLTLILYIISVGLSGIFSDRAIHVSSASPQEPNSVRFESVLRQQRQSARLLVRSSTAERRFQQLSARAIEKGIIPVIATMRVAYSPQLEVRGEVESQVQRYEIGRVSEVLIDELVGYDPGSIKHFDQLPIIALRVNASGIESLRQSDNILDIQEDKLHRASLAESVAFIGGNNAWASGFTGAGQTVAILDTGVDKNHPMLSGKVVSEACYSTTYAPYSSTSVCPGGAGSSTAVNSGLPCPTDCAHGTHVAGIAAGKTVTNGSKTFSGVAKDANIIAIQVFSQFNSDSQCGGPGSAPCVSAYTSDIISGLQRVYYLRSTYSIASANLSLGGEGFSSNCDSDDPDTKMVIDLLRAANIATVIASGNESLKNMIASPACISTAVSVGATLDTVNTVSGYSNSASFLSLLAPGSGITSAVPGTGYGTWNGTSMATPHVAGAWAIMKQKSTTASVPTILAAFQASGVSVTDTNGITKPRIAVDLALARLSTAVPTAPTSLAATAISSTRISLTWIDRSSNETGFVLQRKTGTAGTWATISSPASNTTSYQDTTLAPSTTYYYRLYATNATGQSAASNEAFAKTSDSTAAPTGVTATVISAGQINLSWTDNATNETGYRIERRQTTGTGATTTFSLLVNLGVGVTSYNNTGLLAGTGYGYRVSAIVPGGALVSAAEVTAMTFAVTAVPTGVTVTPISKSQINLKWNDIATNETGYQIERRLTSATVWDAPVPLAVGATTYSDTTGLEAAKSYTYRVSAIAPGGALASAAAVAATTFGETAVPTAVSATAFSKSQINLSWTDEANNETGYRIQRRLTSDTSDTALSLVEDIAANSKAYQNKDLPDTTGYTYVVSAIAPGGALVSAAEVSATTYGPTAAPTSVTATVISAGQINLSWADYATNEMGYRIERRQTTGTGATTTFSLLVNLDANVTSYNNTLLLAGTGYAYRVSAIAPGGALVSATEVTATTSAVTAYPTDVTATPISKSRINLKWTDAAKNETGYQIVRRLTSATVWDAPVLLAEGATTYSDTTGLEVAKSYTYLVSAIAPGGALASGAAVAAKTHGETAVPTGVIAKELSSTKIILTWTDNADNETGYQIQRRLTSDTSDKALSVVADLAPNVRIYENTGLDATTGYTYVVSAIAPGGALVSAAEVSATTYGPTAAPTSVTATVVSSSQINLSWADNATNEMGYRIERRQTTGTGATTTVSLLVNLDANVRSYNNTLLLAGAGYAYRVSAIAPWGALVSATEVTATTFAVTAYPTDVTATPISKSQINLKWTDAAKNETGYQIVRRLTSATVWDAPVLLAEGATTYSDTTGLEAAKSYIYLVSAIAPGGALRSGATVETKTFGETAVPTAVSATAFSKSQINLSWTDEANNETGYRIQRRLTSATDTALSLVEDIAANSKAYQNKDLPDTTGYTYVVSAIAPGGALVSAAEVSATTHGPTDAPTGVAATAVSASQINLSWTDNAKNETGYRIERRQTTGTGATTTFSLLVDLAQGSTSYSNTGLAAATGYAYRVSAIAPGGVLVSAAEVVATTSAVTNAPTGVTATPISKSRIDLSWTDKATNETGYRIQRRLTTDTHATALSVIADLAANINAYQNKDLPDTTGYTYVVSAIAPGGALVSAAQVSATTHGPTDAPTEVAARADSASTINLRWKDNAKNETGYRIERRQTTGTEATTAYSLLVDLAQGSTSYNNTGLLAGTGYAYKVSAIAPGGELVSSLSVDATTHWATAVPTGVTAKAFSKSQINLSWTDNAKDEKGYRIQRRLTTDTSASALSVIADLAANTIVYQNKELADTTGYTYVVSAITPGDTLVSAAQVSATTYGPTDAPTEVAATAFSASTINLRWKDNAKNEMGYRIERRQTTGTGATTAYSLLEDLAQGSTSYSNRGLLAGTGYAYLVSAIAPGGELVSSLSVGATTHGETAVPTGVTATAFSASQINLSWTDNANNETGYRIERRQTTGTGATTAFSLLVNLDANVTSYNNTGLLAGTGYGYRVSAIAPGGALVSATEVTATTSAVTAYPTDVKATPISKSRIDLSWTDKATNETGYRVARRLTTGTVWDEPVLLAVGATTYSDTTGLEAAKSYTYLVSAIAPGGALASAAAVAATTHGETAVPTGVTATAFSKSQINLSWTDKATNEKGYRIQRRLTSDTSDTALSVVADLAPNTIVYQNKDLPDTTGYTYVVSAIAPGDAIVSAAEVSATTHGPTAAPTGVAATAVSASQINLSWTDNANNEMGYRISRRLTAGTVWGDLATLAENTRSYSSIGLAVATGYTYRVSAIAPGGALVSAGDVAATTLATSAPTAVTATVFSSTQINLRWTDVATNETNYLIERRLTFGTAWSSVASLAPNVVAYSNVGLTPSTGYTYRVSAIAPGGAVVSAPEIAATTFGVTAAPTGVTATVFSSTQINLRWTDVATNETNYLIERRVTTGTVWTEVARLAPNVVAYSNTGLNPSTGYTYRVSAIAPGGAAVSAPLVAATTTP